MRRAAPTLLILASLVAMSVALAGGASTFALAQRGTQNLRTDLASVIRADYSTDPAGATLAPLDDGILETARQDEDRLGEAGDGIEIVQVFNPGGLPPGDVAVPGPTPTAGATPGAGETPAPGETPGLGETPIPGATPTPGQTPEPGETPQPTPKPTPTPTPRPTPRPTPTPPPFTLPANWDLYLHNNPTPPSGDTASQAILPMDLSAPTGNKLYNYDTDQDSAPGRQIAGGGLGASETDPEKYQAWRTPPLGAAVTISGTITARLWSVTEEFAPGRGTVTVYLRDFDGTSYTQISSYTLDDLNWNAGTSNWVLKSFPLSVSNYTVAAGHHLELKVIVGASSVAHIWFAYDTANYKSRVSFP